MADFGADVAIPAAVDAICILEMFGEAPLAFDDGVGRVAAVDHDGNTCPAGNHDQRPVSAKAVAAVPIKIARASIARMNDTFVEGAP